MSLSLSVGRRLPSRRSSARRLSRVAAGLSLLILAGCSDGSESVSPPTVQLTTSTTTAPSSTTTTAEVTTSTEDPEAEIIRVYEGTLGYLTVYGTVLDRSALLSLTSDPLLTRLSDRISFYESNEIVVGRDLYDVSIVSITVEGQRATVISCDLDGISLITATGNEYISADTERYLRTAQVQHFSDGWRVTDTQLSGEGQMRCDA